MFKRIRVRDLYGCVDQWNLEFASEPITRKYVTKERIHKKALELANGVVDDLEIDDIIVDISMMHHGMKDKNPVDTVHFYEKSNLSRDYATLGACCDADLLNPDVSRIAGPGDYSVTRPVCHAEFLLRIFTKKSKYFGLVQAAYRAVVEDLRKSELEDGSTDGLLASNTRPPTPATGSPSDDGISLDPQEKAPQTSTPKSTISMSPTARVVPESRKRPFAKSNSIPEISRFGAVPVDFAQPSPAYLMKKPGSRETTTTPSLCM